jgi:ABC-type branched-subunit amino acid transport system ATPase component
MTEQDRQGLELSGLTVTFGGLVAVNGLSLSAPCGRLTGLIGPNGAGKTTTFNACSGLERPSAGHVSLFGDDVTHLGPAARSRRGLSRTYQRMELFDSLSVRDNVALGREAGLAGKNPFRHLWASPKERVDTATRVDDALARCGLEDVAAELVGVLPTGRRRLVELARVIASGSRMVLLDEPSSGLDSTETRRFGEIVRNLVANEGTGILLVEHDMELVMSVCDYLYVLDFGTLIFEGTPTDVHNSEIVRAAYLGELATHDAGDGEAVDVAASTGVS